MSQLALLWAVRCAVGPCARRRARAWAELAQALEALDADDLLEPLGAGSRLALTCFDLPCLAVTCLDLLWLALAALAPPRRGRRELDLIGLDLS